MAGALKMKALLCAERQVRRARSKEARQDGVVNSRQAKHTHPSSASQLTSANRGKIDFLIWSVSTTKKDHSSDCSKNILQEARSPGPRDSERSLIVLFM